MIRAIFQGSAGFLALLFISISVSSFSQSRSTDAILKWEDDIVHFDSLNLVEFSDAGTLLVTGSSSIRMWDSIHKDLAPYQVMQRGYGGAKLTDFNYYADRIIKARKFKAIVVFIANDISGVEEDKTPRQVKQLFKELVKQVRARNPGTPLFWVEVTPTPKRWKVSTEIQEASALIENYCGKHEDLHFIGTFDHYITVQGLPDSTFFMHDMLHLNRSGYRLWSEIIKTSLDKAGIKP